MQRLTPAQKRALKALFDRDHDGASTYLQFRRRARYYNFMGCLMIPWHNMYIGIEPDGYTHS